MLTDFFDTMGTVVSVGEQAGFVDEDGKVPGIRNILAVDSIAASVGGLFGASSITTYIESAAGVAEGGRTRPDRDRHRRRCSRSRRSSRRSSAMVGGGFVIPNDDAVRQLRRQRLPGARGRLLRLPDHRRRAHRRRLPHDAHRPRDPVDRPRGGVPGVPHDRRHPADLQHQLRHRLRLHQLRASSRSSTARPRRFTRSCGSSPRRSSSRSSCPPSRSSSARRGHDGTRPHRPDRRDAAARCRRFRWPLQHLMAMFGATVLVPILTGLDPGVGLMTSGIGTILYLICVRNKIPSYLGSSFAFIAPLIAVGGGPRDRGGKGNLPAALGGLVAAGVVYMIVAGVREGVRHRLAQQAAAAGARRRGRHRHRPRPVGHRREDVDVPVRRPDARASTSRASLVAAITLGVGDRLLELLQGLRQDDPGAAGHHRRLRRRRSRSGSWTSTASRRRAWIGLPHAHVPDVRPRRDPHHRAGRDRRHRRAHRPPARHQRDHRQGLHADAARVAVR